MVRKRKPEEKIDAIKRKRSGNGYFKPRNMVEMFAKKGISMTRQTYSNKENGVTKFNVQEIQVLADVFQMTLAETIHLFNDWD